MKSYGELMAIYEREALAFDKTKVGTIANGKAGNALDKACESLEQWRVDNKA